MKRLSFELVATEETAKVAEKVPDVVLCGALGHVSGTAPIVGIDDDTAERTRTLVSDVLSQESRRTEVVGLSSLPQRWLGVGTMLQQ